jgi:hypothetical protein|tara:strand:+ start:321 stop:875 length:555 start_codon:yes stop_codon:yes gene_type:complete
MELFELDNNYQVRISPQALALSPFRKIWTRDRNKNKKTAIESLSYIYFVCDYKSDYNDITDVEKRKIVVEEAVITVKGWKEDELIIEAMEFYLERSMTATMILLLNARASMAKLSEFLKNIDYDAVDAKGSLKYNSKTISDTAASLGNTITSISQLEEQVKKEISINNNKMKGGREKAHFEDGA